MFGKSKLIHPLRWRDTDKFSRNQLDRYAAPNVVQWHIAGITSRWTKRALAAGGFGYPTLPTEEYSRWRPIFSVAEIGGSSSAAAQAERSTNEQLRRSSFHHHDVEAGKDAITVESYDKHSSEGADLNKALTSSKAYNKVAPVHGLNRPLFHIDLTAALQAAIANVQAQYGHQISSSEDPKRGVGTPSDSDSAEVTNVKHE
jgi:solute carrier family 26 (sodium-independent sulfate anion transporter), member 11